MQHPLNDAHSLAAKVPWNKRKIIGARPPLQTKHVWSIRTKLQLDSKTRDLAMFNLAIDSKLRGCDVVRLKVEDVAPRGLTADQARVRQRKTGNPVKFELTEQAREAVDAYIKAKQKHLGDYLFESRGRPDRYISTRQYSRLVSSWIGGFGLDPRLLEHIRSVAPRPR
jgi:integrase